MNGWYIKSLMVSGNGLKPSIINFVPGVNFILGPSNTGKSLVVETIDYALGGQSNKNNPLKIEENDRGYEEVQLELNTKDGRYIKLNRSLKSDIIELESNDPLFPTGRYNIKDDKTKKIYLKLLGVNESVKLLTNKDKKKLKKLSFRSLLHLFILKQENIDSKTSILLYPKQNNVSEIKCLLNYLLTNKDAREIEEFNTLKSKTSKDEGKFKYIQEILKNTEKEKKELIKIIEKNKSSIIKIKLENNQFVDIIGNDFNKIIENEIDKIKKNMNKFLEENKILVKDIGKLEEVLNENTILKTTLEKLHKQYESDLSRFNFVVDGIIEIDKLEHNIICPTCNSSINRKIEVSKDFYEGTLNEYSSLCLNISELKITQNDLESKINKLIENIEFKRNLKTQNENAINIKLKPVLDELKELHKYHTQIERLKGRLDEIDKQIDAYTKESITHKELVDEYNKVKEEINTKEYFFDEETLKKYVEKLSSAIKKCKIEETSNTKFDIGCLDVEIDGKLKSVSMGGGYMSVINYLLALTNFDFLKENGGKTLGFLIADSILTQLSEAEGLKDEATIKTSILNYVLNEPHQGQLIIVEQTKRMPFIPDDVENVKVIKFSGEKNNGRKGFLIDDINEK